MTRVAFFDTNVLGIHSDLSNPFWFTIRLLCAEAGIDPCIPEVVLREAVNLRREKYGAARANFLAAFKNLSRFFDAEGVYVPDVDSIASEWEASLREVFTVVPTHPDDAVESIHREASRHPPARAGRGGRDSLIWLTAKREARAGVEVILISRNTRDFTRESKDELHPVLSEEAEAVEGTLRYFNGLDAFIDYVATKTEPPELAPERCAELLDLDLRAALLEAGDGASARDDDALACAKVRVSDLRILRTYEVESRGLSLVEGRAELTDSSEDQDAFSNREVFFLAWIEVDVATSDPVSADLQKITLSG